MRGSSAARGSLISASLAASSAIANTAWSKRSSSTGAPVKSSICARSTSSGGSMTALPAPRKIHSTGRPATGSAGTSTPLSRTTAPRPVPSRKPCTRTASSGRAAPLRIAASSSAGSAA
jgi:hypothetical protein